MRRQQKTQTFCEEYQPSAEASQPENFTEGKTLKKQRSTPKFNRTSESKPFDKRKTSKQTEEHRVCYISPAKNNEPRTIVSTSIEEMAHKFALPKEFFSQNHGQQQRKLPEQQIISLPEQNLHIMLARKDQQIQLLKLQVEGLIKSLKLLEGCEQKLLRRQEEVQFMQKFLLEREAYISQMIENNIHMNENSVLQDKIKNQLEEALFKAHMSKVELETKFGECEQLWKTVLEAQKKEIETLRAGKKKSQGGEKKHSGKQMKENQSVNRSKSMRSKEQQPFKGKSIGDRHIKRLDTNISQTENSSNQRFDLPINGKDECPKNLEVIQSLEKKIRYSTIELDILRRAKMQSTKINEDNERLRVQNRKLLHRIDYLANNFRRDRRNSDSSMDLSLSPSRQ